MNSIKKPTEVTIKKSNKKKLIMLITIFLIIIIIGAGLIRFLLDLAHPTEHRFTQIIDGNAPSVYMTKDISPEGLMSIYEKLDRPANGAVAVKISTGEPGGNNYLKPALIEKLVEFVEGTIVETNTAYGGQRINTALHLQVAEDHGFTSIAPVDILDSGGELNLPVLKGSRLSENVVGANIDNYDSYIILSHFKGHQMGGFGGAIKNLSIGFASPRGKSLIHSGGYSDVFMISFIVNIVGGQTGFLESMAETAGTIMDKADENILYINVLNNLSIDCDCSDSPTAVEMHDIGILAALDPVALDKASIDLIYQAENGKALISRIENRNGLYLLEYAEKIGLGSQEYILINIDE